MAFDKEPTGYLKTAITDLQGAWVCLRGSVVDHFGFPDSDKLLFHIDEAMSWESVRDLSRMKSTFLLIHNIASQTNTPDEVLEWVDGVRETLADVFKAIDGGEAV